MERWLLGIYIVISGLAVVQAVLVVIQTWEHHRYARSRLALMRKYPRKGRALVVVPCRGVDVGLARNLHTLFHQDYGNYQIRFVVESDADSACAVIRRLMAAHPEKHAELLVAGNAAREGQKIHNLRYATAGLPAGVEYLAFADSDARLRRQWLRALLTRIDRPGVGAVTGYRWFVPSRPSFANHLLHSINSHIAVLFGSRCPTIVWGGSWAMRRDKFEALGARAAWAGTLSDDLVASRILRSAGLRVLFEPACLVTSPADITLGGLLEFVRRQYLMGRWYLPRGWAFALLMTTFVNAVSVANVGVLLAAVATGLMKPGLPATFCGVLYVLSMFAGLLRQDLALSYFPHLHSKLRGARRFEIWTGPLAAVVNWMCVLDSMFGHSVRWRGIGYAVGPDGKVTATDRTATAAERLAVQPEQPALSEDLAEPDVIPMPSVRIRKGKGPSRDRSRRRSA
jgi:cellulose synthase/poly-beta-1,6-N-acetylglucosamine synthase-like glycosyltransferase